MLRHWEDTDKLCNRRPDIKRFLWFIFQDWLIAHCVYYPIPVHLGKVIVNCCLEHCSFSGSIMVLVIQRFRMALKNQWYLVISMIKVKMVCGLEGNLQVMVLQCTQIYLGSVDCLVYAIWGTQPSNFSVFRECFTFQTLVVEAIIFNSAGWIISYTGCFVLDDVKLLECCWNWALPGKWSIPLSCWLVLFSL